MIGTSLVTEARLLWGSAGNLGIGRWGGDGWAASMPPSGALEPAACVSQPSQQRGRSSPHLATVSPGNTCVCMCVCYRGGGVAGPGF